MDLHIKAYPWNHWLLSLYAFKYLQRSVTLLSRGGTNILVITQTLMYKVTIHLVCPYQNLLTLYVEWYTS